MIRHGIPYVWAWPNRPSLLVESGFVALIKGLNGYTHHASLREEPSGVIHNSVVYLPCTHLSYVYWQTRPLLHPNIVQVLVVSVPPTRVVWS